MDRRTFLAVAGGTAAVAGCTSGDSQEDTDGGEGNETNTTDEA